MLAIIDQVEGGFTARFERFQRHAVGEVWTWLTENEKLSQWFPELHVEELCADGLIKFDMGDAIFVEMKITEFKKNSLLEYTWGDDLVRFELNPTQEGSLLVLTEKFKVITDHTPRDLAGWHVCLDVISVLMDGRAIESRSKEWQKWYEQYVLALETVIEN